MSYRPVNTNPPRRRHKTPAEIRRDYGPALGNDFSEMLPRIEDYLNRTLQRIGQAPQENLQGLMTAGELIERLRQYPADAAVVIEYCDPRSMTYNEERNLIKID